MSNDKAETSSNTDVAATIDKQMLERDAKAVPGPATTPEPPLDSEVRPAFDQVPRTQGRLGFWAARCLAGGGRLMHPSSPPVRSGRLPAK